MGIENNAIGVFDSGLGGLTVVRELMRNLPGEDIVYYGDTARVPYGTKSRASIIRFSRENAKILLRHQVKMIVVACHSSSSYALRILRTQLDVPVIGVIIPGAIKAISATRNKKIGIIATRATVNSGQYDRIIHKQDADVKVIARACPLFVPLVEEGWLESSVTVDVARRYFTELKRAKIDTLILGCTHYPLLKRTIHKVMGSNVTLIDSAKEVSLEVKQMLEKARQGRQGKRKAHHKFLISDRPQEFAKMAKNFLGMEIVLSHS